MFIVKDLKRNIKKEEKKNRKVRKRKREDPLHRSNSIAVFCCRFNILLCHIYFKCTMTTWHTMRTCNIYIYIEYIYIWPVRMKMVRGKN